MAQRVFRRTVGLDVSGLAASNERKDVCQFIVEHFAHLNIHAVQFVGTIAKVTFAAEASKLQVMCHQSVNIQGVQCAVRGGGPRLQNVLVYNYPVEGDEDLLRRYLAVYGTIESVAFRHWTNLPNVSDGVRTVRMVRREPIPRHLTIGDFPVKISYAGQQQVCDLCAAPGHIARVCPKKGKCFQCGLEGHLSRNCPQRAGYRARDDPAEVVSDPTPAEARASGAPQSESDVDLRDNQLDELSQSILAPVLAGPPPGPSLPADDVSVDSFDVDNVVNNEVTNNKVNENSDNVVENNEVNSNVNSNGSNVVGNNEVNNNVVESNEVNSNGSNMNNNVVINESIVVNSNLVENESTVNNNVVGAISVSQIGAADQISIEPNYASVSDSVNIVDPGSSSLCASSLDSCENLVEPSSSELISSAGSVRAPDSRKRVHFEVSSDEDVDSSPATVFKSKLPVRKHKGVRKPPAPAPSTATPRALRSSGIIPGLSKGLKLAAAEWGRIAKRS